jgi:ribosomal protein L22
MMATEQKDNIDVRKMEKKNIVNTAKAPKIIYSKNNENRRTEEKIVNDNKEQTSDNKAEQKTQEIKSANDNKPQTPDNKVAAVTEKKAEGKSEDKKTEEKKKEAPKITKKDEAVAKTLSMPISKKHGMYIGAFIKGKPIDQAIRELQEVMKFKRAIPMKGEIPHRKGKGMMSGRYPIVACKHIINTLKALKGNIAVNGMDLEKSRIVFVTSSWASRPQQGGGARFKRAHIVIKAREVTNPKETKK